jgi:glyoxylase-like metal-dependent hydrolase (beta-lactamase superfamily II)
VEILWLGRAHTDGDALVYLPAEKVLVTGDVLHGWTPTMRDSYPYEWIETLDIAEKLDFEHVIPGHGEVMHRKERFELWKEFFRDLLERTAAAFAEGATQDEAKERVSKALTPIYADRLLHFPQNVAGDVAKAYQVINPSR